MVYVCFRVLLSDMRWLAGIATLRYGGSFKKRFLGKYIYHNYYLTEKNLTSDPRAKKIASVIHSGYVNTWYEDYYSNLSEEHLPLNVFVNWTRSIADDLLESVNPINNVKGWDNYLHNPSSFDNIFRQESVIFEDFEQAYIWGGVYYWLKCFAKDFNNELLLNQIEEVACRKKYLTPYFMLFKNMANGIETDYSMSFNCTESNISDKSITSEQTALLWLAIAKQSEGEIKNKKKLAPVIHRLTGVGEKSLAQKLCGVFKDEDKRTLINIIEGQLPNLANKILNIEKSHPLPEN